MSIKVYNPSTSEWEVLLPTKGETGNKGPQGSPGPVNISDAIDNDSSSTAASSKAIKALADEIARLKALLTQ